MRPSDLAHHESVVDQGDELAGTAAGGTGQDVDGEDAFEELGPGEALAWRARRGETARGLDVVMPDLGGRAVFDRIRESHPQVRVLFCSGYSANAIHTNFVLAEGLALIPKPYKRDELRR